MCLFSCNGVAAEERGRCRSVNAPWSAQTTVSHTQDPGRAVRAVPVAATTVHAVYVGAAQLASHTSPHGFQLLTHPTSWNQNRVLIPLPRPPSGRHRALPTTLPFAPLPLRPPARVTLAPSPSAPAPPLARLPSTGSRCTRGGPCPPRMPQQAPAALAARAPPGRRPGRHQTPRRLA